MHCGVAAQSSISVQLEKLFAFWCRCRGEGERGKSSIASYTSNYNSGLVSQCHFTSASPHHPHPTLIMKLMSVWSKQTRRFEFLKTDSQQKFLFQSVKNLRGRGSSTNTGQIYTQRQRQVIDSAVKSKFCTGCNLLEQKMIIK